MNEISVRKPAAAGRFYEASAGGLRRQVESLIDRDVPKEDAVGCILPHAGYMYSGRIAGRTVSALKVRPHLVLLGPNHTGMGAPFSVSSRQSWETPLGKCEPDRGLADALTAECPFLREDQQAHLAEHSLEVELPFFQYFSGDFRVLPVCIGSDDFVKLQELGRAIAAAVDKAASRDSVLIAASSDMTHYEDSRSAKEKDEAALEAIVSFNAQELYRRVIEKGISMCGYAPVITLLTAARLLGARRAKVIAYSNSGMVNGDQSSVVGYAGVLIS
ncbi:MAG: AmmeMemoRadiSam system protein B [Candidatus Omnitrophota bacterium]|jgi:hypothetical protein